eukprot:TRINITY_DN23644_c0_g1_i1.p1 TRINITY_DN23644_c0_g1~~TRINITY_DN23644_c0_g1_i1.p1  ORF type:complete len:515 (-),score=100.67 TRINITY_DN23644_c0_g1_i1:72-1436(-)
MVDGLMAENEQLEGVARLLARHVNGSSEQQVAALTASVEELLRQGADLRHLRVEQVEELQRELREERLESQHLRRRLEGALAELAAQPPPPFTASDNGALLASANAGLDEAAFNKGGTNNLAARVAHAERVREHEVRRREFAEARCALVEHRCQRVIERIVSDSLFAAHDADLLGTLVAGEKAVGDHSQACSRYGGSDRGGGTGTATPEMFAFASDSNLPSDDGRLAVGASSSLPPVSDEVLALREQLRREREAYQQHSDLYSRYVPELTAICGRSQSHDIPGVSVVSPSPTLLVDDDVVAPTAFVSGSRGSSDLGTPASQNRNICDGPEEVTRSDDEDYTCEGYVERAVGSTGDIFERVYLKLARGFLTLLEDRSSKASLACCPLTSLLRIGISGARCFEVIARSDKDDEEAVNWVFRCVSGRRAEQWVEDVNSAWRHGSGSISLNCSVDGMS